MNRRKKYSWAAFVLIFLSAIFLSQSEVSLSGAEKSRFSVIEAVGERGRFEMNEIFFTNVDKVVYEGKIYSDKPLCLSWVLGLAYRVCRNFGLPDFRENYHGAVYGIDLLFFTTVNFLFFLWLFHAFLRLKEGSFFLKWLLALASLFGTWMLSYGTIVNNHTPAALVVLGLFVVLEKFRRRPCVSLALIAGMTAGVLGVMELPFGLFFASATLLCVALCAPSGQKRRCFLFAAAGGAAMLCWMFLLNFYAYGSVLPLYVISGGSYQAPEIVRAGLWRYGWDIFLGSRGLFSYQPFLLFGVLWAVFSLFFRENGKNHALSGTMDVVEKTMLSASLAAMLFYWFFTNEYGGWGYGFRYLIPVIPLFWYWGSRLIFRVSSVIVKLVAALLILWGVLTSFVGAYVPYCPAYEGTRTRPGDFSEAIQSTFSGNLLLITYRHAPNSPLFSALTKRYGEKNVSDYLFWATVNAGLPDESLGIGNRKETLEKFFHKRRGQHHENR